MKYLVIFVIGVVVGLIAVQMRSKKESLIDEQGRQKQENKQKILVFLQGRDRVSNDEIQNLLGVSDSTATRYLQELEKDGVLKQVGATGKHVYYEKQP